MNFKVLNTVVVSLMMSVSCIVNAGVISISDSGLIGTDNNEHFNSGRLGTNVSTEFISSGLTFQTLSGFGVTHTSVSNCNNSTRGMVGGYLYAGLSGLCNSAINTVESFSINFAKDVSELSWKGFHLSSAGTTSGYKIEVFDKNSLLSQLVLDQTNNFDNRFINITGSNFNKITITQMANHTGWLGMDNFAWNDSTDIPEPSTLAIFALGMIGLTSRRFKKHP